MLHERVRVGDLLNISAPKNHFALAHGAQHSILLAGGIGVTPLLCMAERLAITGASFEMHYCTRSRERTAFASRIEAAPFARLVAFHHDDGADDQKLALGAVLSRPRPGVHVYVCGPKGFMDWVLESAHQHGWPADQLHCEFFTADVVTSEQDASFEVQLASSGKVIAVSQHQTVVQALGGRRYRSGHVM